MIELRIKGQLCDLSDDFSITLKRVFYDPTQLITKDAQSSYSISLPMTDNNRRIFNYKNTPEVTNKFGELYKASLVVDSESIFEGDFRLDEITPDMVKGNLCIIFKYSLKDVLGDKYMNQCGEWLVDFFDINKSIKELNEKTDSECIFPLVMYGLLPKYADNEGNYTAKNIYDSTVGFRTLGAFPPSINCIQMIQKVFINSKLNLSGTALGDPRLKNLYMSYKNPSEYEMEWNYGYTGVIKLEGEWSNYKNLNDGTDWVNEPTTSINTSPKSSGTEEVYNTDLLSTVNGTVNITSDNGFNVDKKNISSDPDTNTPAYTSRKIRVPYSGYYKVTFSADFKYNVNKDANSLLSTKYGDKTIKALSPKFLTQGSDGKVFEHLSTIEDRRLEIKVVRDRSNGGFDFSEMDIDMAYYEDAINQIPGFSTENPKSKYFPKGGETCFIDANQSKQLICGIGFGKGYGDQKNIYADIIETDVRYKYTHPIAMKGGYSYNGEDNDFQCIATPSNGYMEAVGATFFKQSKKYKEDIANTDTYSCADKNLCGGLGKVQTIVWLNQGELLTVVHSCDLDQNIYSSSRKGADIQDVRYTLSIEPFKKEKTWLTDKLNDNGDETITRIYYNDKTDFRYSDINLISFLPSNVKINDWITNFCNAFNLSLIQLDDTHYELNTNKGLASYGTNYIDISKKLYQGYKPTYKPLEIPYSYDLGFTVKDEEEGYTKTKESGGGKFQTWRTDGSPLTQNSTFSYCWYKDIKFDLPELKDTLPIPIISDKEPFDLDHPRDYNEMQQKDYYDYAQRFWYKGGNIKLPVNKKDLTVSLVKGALDGQMTLDYHNEPLSIMRNFFAVITGSETSYTSVSCYLEQWEFNRLASSFVIFNNDVFFVSSVDSYNPITKVAQLRLIRKSIL